MGLCLRTCLMAGAILCILGEGVQGQEPDAPSPGGRPTSGPVPASSPTTAAAGEDEVATWLGLRPRLTEAGVTPILSYILDSSRNFRGGLNTHDWALRHLLTAGLDMDMEKVAGIKGGEFYATFIDHHGSNGSALTGDIQMYSSIDANSRDELYEVWYQQKLLDDKLRLKVGKIDATKEFAFTDNGADFLSSPMGFSPALVDFPTYPDPTYGLSIYAYPSDWLYAGFGYFDRGLQEEWPVGSPAPVNSGQFLIGEVGAKWKLGANELPGRLGLGAYGHTGTFEEFGGGLLDGTAGPYAVFDQTLWRPSPQDKEDKRQLGAFFQYGGADERISKVTQHVGAGLAWRGLVPGRPSDVLGAGLTRVELSDEPAAGFSARHETAVETFYKVVLTPWLSVTPDLQYTANPGGNGTPDALVGTIRLQVSW